MTKLKENEKLFVTIPNVDSYSIPIKKRKEGELLLQKYYEKNEKTKKFARDYTPFLDDAIEHHLNGLTRHDFFKFAVGCAHKPKEFRKIFNRVWDKYCFKFSPLQKHKDLKNWARQINKALVSFK